MPHGPHVDGCRSCEALAAMRPLSGIPYVYVGEHFVIDHAVPVARPGWFVIVTRRHLAALHELSTEEWDELGLVLPRLISAVHAVCGSQKEYVMQLAEAPGFQHIHWHVVAVQHEDTRRGTEIFHLLKPTHPMTAVDLTPTCDDVRRRLES